ncbi:DUF3341 domain-containing protein [Bdellovibrio sp. NC01]|uniref:DUF3341 domain-containing protein n=1 Tax=Bdellovibrio sp. NC01 TaxID=2220073 RepID=UPI00115709AD|nr:DUF3341 domain-containing protein [Bdellovibrio sp. NC01]QDK37248.1 DUF3341 domain-containing protein [Bdellovibrio sp. NC01]
MAIGHDHGEKGHKAVFGIFESKSQLESTVDSLKSDGFRNTDISVLMPSSESTKNFAHEKSTKAPEGAATGATGGLAIGGVLGWLAGIGALAIPGIGPFVAAGPIVAAIAGAGIGGAVGGIAGALVGLGIPEYEAKRYEELIKGGGMLLSVHVDDSDWQDRAEKILKLGGAHDIASTGEEKAPPQVKGDRNIHPHT